MRPFGAAVMALLLVALLPTDALAWTPGTHILLGDAVLRAAPQLLPAAIAALLRAHPTDFLYGSIAADTSFAKRYARVGRHCHHWPVADDILDHAREAPLQAFAWGYLSHLAADVVAHNHFVPLQLALTSASGGAGHGYWESRFELHTGEGWSRRARELIRLDHARADSHLDRILSPTIFTTSTNRRLFRGMVHASDTASWQRMMTAMATRSRWVLRDATVAAHLEVAFEYIVDLLRADGGAAETPAIARGFDPSGEAALREAVRFRRTAVGAGAGTVRRDARLRYALPTILPGWSASLPAPLHVVRPAPGANERRDA